MAFFISFRVGEKEIKKEYTDAVLLKDAISESGIAFAMPCGGRGVCGNCKVYAKGDLSTPNEKERTFLGNEIINGARLACFVTVFGDAEIKIPDGFVSETNEESDRDFDTDPISGEKKCFACAIDVGTTTLFLRYYSLPEGRIVLQEHIPNPQCVRGADVLTRIEYASNGGLDELRDLVERVIDDSAIRFGEDIEFYVITGNTAMLHILSGRSPKGLAVSPFIPETLFGFWEGNRYYMPCASAYIGADVISSLLASGITKIETPSALLDIGTNNECILWDGKRLFACSSPAGPAFEGANISCGVAANKGAIYKVKDSDGIPVPFTLDADSVPCGFCGSGLIDFVAFLFKNGYITKDGSVIKDFPDFDGITLLPEDIAEVQLAKSAVCAGLLTLCETAGIQPKKLYLTGSFGNKLNAENAEYIGMIPKGVSKNCEISVCGAIEGASKLILNKNAFELANKLAKSVKYVELADSSYFEKAFIENLYF